MSSLFKKSLSSLGSSLATAAGPAIAVSAISAVATALWVRSRANRAEREHPPRGKFVEVDGVRLHYVEQGSGPAVVLLHGNTVSLEDFQASGLLGDLAKGHRVIAFDRPGLGHSSRPRNRLWTPAAQAELLHRAMQRLGVERAAVVGHSLGTLVALALALDHPESVSTLVLLGGYYYLTPRIDSILLAPVALPGLGDVLRYTTAALSSRALLGSAVKAMFSPREVPVDFFPVVSREMMLRPSQLRADVEDGVLMLPGAKSNAARYGELRMPVTIIAGGADKVVDPDAHSVRLHDDIAQSDLIVLPGTGHMVHYVAREQIVAAVDRSTDPATATATTTAAALAE